MFINDAFAQTAGAAGGSDITATIVQLVLIFVIFYFLLIRPQQKKIKQHEALLMTIKRGDKVLTGGGIVATVEKVVGEDVEVNIAPNVNITVIRSTLRDVIKEKSNKEEKASSETKTKTKAKKK